MNILCLRLIVVQYFFWGGDTATADNIYDYMRLDQNVMRLNIIQINYNVQGMELW
jgi:hypothetical protein